MAKHKKTPAQLDREIASVLAKGKRKSRHGAKVQDDIFQHCGI